jgi:hypothetical protein
MRAFHPRVIAPVLDRRMSGRGPDPVTGPDPKSITLRENSAWHRAT